jgi:hypothetical protein
MKSIDAKTTDQRSVREILSLLAAANVPVEDFHPELPSGVVAKCAGSASSSTE